MPLLSAPPTPTPMLQFCGDTRRVLVLAAAASIAFPNMEECCVASNGRDDACAEETLLLLLLLLLMLLMLLMLMLLMLLPLPVLLMAENTIGEFAPDDSSLLTSDDGRSERILAVNNAAPPQAPDDKKADDVDEEDEEDKDGDEDDEINAVEMEECGGGAEPGSGGKCVETMSAASKPTSAPDALLDDTMSSAVGEGDAIGAGAKDKDNCAANDDGANAMLAFGVSTGAATAALALAALLETRSASSRPVDATSPENIKLAALAAAICSIVTSLAADNSSARLASMMSHACERMRPRSKRFSGSTLSMLVMMSLHAANYQCE